MAIRPIAVNLKCGLVEIKHRLRINSQAKDDMSNQFDPEFAQIIRSVSTDVSSVAAELIPQRLRPPPNSAISKLT